ncbi:MAG: hypothetical protein HOW73_23590 [Polyangiaceae bacterium]|nr:hypothetical protein [Polyangiaceae bacterium]
MPLSTAAVAGMMAASMAFVAPAHASPQDVLGYGARSSAMAGAGVAFGEGFETVYTNPSLLSLSKNKELDFGFTGAVFQLEANGPLGTDGLAAGVLGGVLPIPLPDPVGDRIVLGFGFYTPFDLVVRSRILYPETPQYLLPDSVESIAAIVGLGVDIGWGIHVGGGFEALAALAGSVLVSVDASGQLGAVVQDTLVANYAPIAGVSVDVPGGFRAGLTFRGSLEGRFDVRIDIKDLGQITVPPIFVSGTAQYDPLTVETEFARVTGPLRGAVAVGYRRWSAYPGLAEPTVRCPLDVNTFDIPLCAALRPAAPNFSDTVIARGSVEYTLVPRTGVELDFRAGYAFESAPGPEQTGADNLFAEARSVIGLGIGTAIVEPIVKGLHVDTFAQLGVIHGRTHEKDGSVDASNPGFPSIETGGTMFAAGATAGVAF